jgi:hypothetical protein
MYVCIYVLTSNCPVRVPLIFTLTLVCCDVILINLINLLGRLNNFRQLDINEQTQYTQQ